MRLEDTLLDVTTSPYSEPRRDFTPLLHLLQCNHVPPGRALDIGCGEGYFGEVLLSRGHREVWGVEPEPTAAQRAEQRLSGVVAGAFPDVALDEKGLFDLIVFADSLEHIVDPWGALRKARELLAPRGRLLFSAPNVSHYSILSQLFRNSWPYSDSGLLDRTHVRFFTPKSLRGYLEDAGFRVVAADIVLATPGNHRLLSSLVAKLLPHVLVYQALFLAAARGAAVNSAKSSRRPT